ncbi:MAG TPA: LLM class flavin-dependent oxidoreductase [Dehalococcoidia bacterium]|jgi:alkanesulfonate monooxygenase SsuD/methylene tetrahydromethanopterin reductase-like flavin-dependent oxidoreductase (luciferase family)|nr:LLM class flavin-dependent oxidoreductase [Dehalococcoidia bacterium]
MLIGHFTEQPWQDDTSGLMGTQSTDLGISNSHYDPLVGAGLYNRYLDEKMYAEEMGFEAFMLNEHHSTPFCMQGVTNIGAAILARQTKKAKIIILGNVLPIWDDPLWLAEQLSMIDMISYGRLVSGFVRGGGRESFAHNAPPHFNRERFEEAHDFIIKAWTEPGPWRWEGKHYQYRYVNPWARPLQQPHPQIWIPSTVSVETVKWTAEHRYPLVLLATKLEPTKDAFQLYHDTAKENGYESGTQNLAYLFKVHVDETEEKADEVARKFLSGVSNPFLSGNEGQVNPAIMGLPGHTSRTSNRLQAAKFGPTGRFGTNRRPYEDQVKDLTIISGTPKTVIPKIKHVLEYLRPGSIFFWDGDGAMTHEDQMRSLRLMGEEVIPAVKEIGKELELFSSFEVDPATGKKINAETTIP